MVLASPSRPSDLKCGALCLRRAQLSLVCVASIFVLIFDFFKGLSQNFATYLFHPKDETCACDAPQIMLVENHEPSSFLLAFFFFGHMATEVGRYFLFLQTNIFFVCENIPNYAKTKKTRRATWRPGASTLLCKLHRTAYFVVLIVGVLPIVIKGSLSFCLFVGHVYRY